jgi:hypothetical protein
MSLLSNFRPRARGIESLAPGGTGGALMSLRLLLGVAVLLVIGVTAAVQLPTWIVLPLGALALASLYIVARLRSRFDPLDPRFGSCIPPITKPRDQ